MQIRLWWLVAGMLIMLSVGELYAQASPITRKHLKQIIREGIHNNDDQYYTLLGCNEDSLYFTADTIHFYDNAKFFDQIGICCEFVEWEFTGDDLLRKQEPQTCMEPSSVEVSTRKYYKYRMKKWGGNVYFQLMEQKKPTAAYRLTNIEYIELADLTPCIAITLVRVKKTIPEEPPKDTLKQIAMDPTLKKKRKRTRENPIMITMERLIPKLPNLKLMEKVAPMKPIMKKSVNIIR